MDEDPFLKLAVTHNYPLILAKACLDTSWQYELRTRHGTVIQFTKAETINKEWVKLSFDQNLAYCFDDSGALRPPARGLELRVDEIAIIIDYGH